MARNPVFALLWLVMLFFLAWPIAAACAGVRYLSRRLLSLCSQIGCAAIRTSAGAAGRSPAGAMVPTCFSPFSDEYFVYFRCYCGFSIQAWLILQVSQPATITYDKVLGVLHMSLKDLLSSLPQSLSKGVSASSRT
jgi:hypothetical protein